MDSRTFNIAPKPAFLLALANSKWNAAGAVSELVDNSLGKLRGNANNVEVTYEGKTRIMTVFDDGRGMNHIGDLFQLGKTVGMGPGDIGRYGSGGTMALIWLASKVRIWTLRNGQVMREEVLWRDIMAAKSLADVNVNDTWEVASLRNTPVRLFEANHGTYIELHIKREKTITPSAIQAELSRTYAPALRHGKKLVWITVSRGQDHVLPISDPSIMLPDDPKNRIDFQITLDTGAAHLPVRGSVGLIEDLPYPNSCIAVGFGPRVIFRTRDCYMSQDGEKRYSGGGITGWLDLGDGWQPYLTTTKDDIHDEPVRAVLMDHIFNAIESLLKRTEEDRFSIILEGVALELEGALNNLNELEFLVEQNTTVKPGPKEPNPLPTPIDPPDVPRPAPMIVPKGEEAKSDDPGAVPGKRPPVSRISIQQVSDEDLSGALCRMDVQNEHESNFAIEVNRDHAVIQEIMKAKPMNRIALNLMLTREIASSLVAHEAVLENALPEKIYQKLDTLGSNAQRERTLARLLMDSARRPKLVDEVA